MFTHIFIQIQIYFILSIILKNLYSSHAAKNTSV
jgi:hypothetical protein